MGLRALEEVRQSLRVGWFASAWFALTVRDEAVAANLLTGETGQTGPMMSVMFAAVGLQAAVVLGLAIVALAVSGGTASWHLMLGGLTATVPNALFALRLALHRGRSPESYPTVFFLGEFAKIGLTVGLLALLIRYESNLQWLPMLIGLIAALKAPLLMMAWRRV